VNRDRGALCQHPIDTFEYLNQLLGADELLCEGDVRQVCFIESKAPRSFIGQRAAERNGTRGYLRWWKDRDVNSDEFGRRHRRPWLC